MLGYAYNVKAFQFSYFGHYFFSRIKKEVHLLKLLTNKISMIKRKPANRNWNRIEGKSREPRQRRPCAESELRWSSCLAVLTMVPVVFGCVFARFHFSPMETITQVRNRWMKAAISTDYPHFGLFRTKQYVWNYLLDAECMTWMDRTALITKNRGLLMPSRYLFAWGFLRKLYTSISVISRFKYTSHPFRLQCVQQCFRYSNTDYTPKPVGVRDNWNVRLQGFMEICTPKELRECSVSCVYWIIKVADQM